MPQGSSAVRPTNGLYLFLMTTFRSVLFRTRNVAYKSCRENQNTHFMLKTFFFENRAVYEVMWKNVVQPDKPYGVCALHAGYLRLQTHAKNM